MVGIGQSQMQGDSHKGLTVLVAGYLRMLVLAFEHLRVADAIERNHNIRRQAGWLRQEA